MTPIHVLAARDSQDDGAFTPSTVDLLISLLVLILLAIVLAGSLLVLRQRRRKLEQQSQLPLYKSQAHQRSLTITQNSRTGSIHVYNEKQGLQSSLSPPPSPVPEIRITFPDEKDESGRPQAGRVVVVHISENGGVGLSPMKEELPPYQTNESGRFQSLDLERMGGLKEKEEIKTWS
ncbi:hypothetical protein UA08_01423 [Talaromyces atroroseus]|uniref:Uncharacterized protein n=1 Tax=Talaromyces atroroseus TaxID=1441469 RepID=A0A1Q5Q9K2_TALAT|nr:hypothetical protein UA08_01423 [Talaromyces atroroseus]OKL62616.1 hypothetical protein UA08_01423 [Talaromyces atroroseus]